MFTKKQNNLSIHQQEFSITMQIERKIKNFAIAFFLQNPVGFFYVKVRSINCKVKHNNGYWLLRE